MENAKDITDRLIYRAKNLTEWIVTKKLPNGFKYLGAVPFDMFIDKRSVAEFKVWAVTAEEAEKQVDDWINNLKDSDGQ
jgi:hypothetical protein